MPPAARHRCPVRHLAHRPPLPDPSTRSRQAAPSLGPSYKGTDPSAVPSVRAASWAGSGCVSAPSPARATAKALLSVRSRSLDASGAAAHPSDLVAAHGHCRSPAAAAAFDHFSRHHLLHDAKAVGRPLLWLCALGAKAAPHDAVHSVWWLTRRRRQPPSAACTARIALPHSTCR